MYCSELGDQAQVDLTSDIRARLNEVEQLQAAFSRIVTHEVSRIKTEMEAKYQQLLWEHKMKRQEKTSDDWDTKLEALLELENEKLERVNVEWELRMKDALAKQENGLTKEWEEKMTKALKEQEDRLNAEIERRAAEALNWQMEHLEVGAEFFTWLVTYLYTFFLLNPRFQEVYV